MSVYIYHLLGCLPFSLFVWMYEYVRPLHIACAVYAFYVFTDWQCVCLLIRNTLYTWTCIRIGRIHWIEEKKKRWMMYDSDGIGDSDGDYDADDGDVCDKKKSRITYIYNMSGQTYYLNKGYHTLSTSSLSSLLSSSFHREWEFAGIF